MAELLSSRVFFITVHLKNLENLELSPLVGEDGLPLDGTGEKILNTLCSLFENSKPGRLCCGSSCISASGLYHLHLGAYSPTEMRFKSVAKFFGNAHVEPQRGNRKQIEDYVLKRGEYADMGEKVLYASQDMSAFVGRQGNRTELQKIEEFLEAGLKPHEIYDVNFSLRKHDKIVRDAYFDGLYRNTPFVRDVKVYWHVGESGTGKSHTVLDLIGEHGPDSVYFVTDYSNGWLDRYCGERILFLDEFRGQLRYSSLLSLLDKYKIQVHCRYSNAVSLWDEVHITSVLSPDMVYKKLISDDSDREYDTFAQLKRRITAIVYHWKDEKGAYLSYSLPSSEYKDIFHLKKQARAEEFVTLDDNVKLPFLDCPFLPD